MWIPVIFYDFKADGSNPDFQSCTVRSATGMIQSSLRDTARIRGDTAIVPVVDTVGPKIAEVKYYVGRMPWEDTGPSDTLIITFNEPVRSQDIQDIMSGRTSLDNIFDIQGEHREQVVFQGATVFDTGSRDSGIITIAVELPENWNISVHRDSIAIKPAKLHDVEGNESLEEPSSIKSKPYRLVPRAAPNPFVPGKSEIPAAILGKVDRSSTTRRCPYTESGIIIKILAVDELNPQTSSLTIYDATGSVVVEDVCGYSEVDNPKCMYFFWDGKNRNGRTVGGGTYLCDIRAYKVADNSDVTQRLKIGVKRRSNW